MKCVITFLDDKTEMFENVSDVGIIPNIGQYVVNNPNKEPIAFVPISVVKLVRFPDRDTTLTLVK